MTQAANMVNNGISPGMANAITGTYQDLAVTATAAPGQALVGDVIRLSSVASGGHVFLPAAPIGDTLLIVNRGGNAATINPPSNQTINNTTSLSLADNGRAWLFKSGPTQWDAVVSA